METSVPRWYSRPELPGPWVVAACPEHGRFLEAHRFMRGEAPANRKLPDRCALCDRPEMIEEIEACTCERDTAGCPAHRIIGCGG